MGAFPNRGVMRLNVTDKYRLCLRHAFIFPLNLIFPGVWFSIVLVHSNYNCGMNLMVIASKEGAQPADCNVVFIRLLAATILLL